jgi:2,3-bisphosphoglycerate-dependent phosphoglycerate mutase
MDWRLNERHYGALTGLSKATAVTRYGAAQVKSWRRSFNVIPPLGQGDACGFPMLDQRYPPKVTDNVPQGDRYPWS